MSSRNAVPGKRLIPVQRSFELSRTDSGQVTVPHEPVELRQVDLRFAPCLIEQAQHHALRHLGKQRKVRPGAVVGSTKRISASRPNPHVEMMAHPARPRRTPTVATGLSLGRSPHRDT
jgi:hypothetical protein